jgi:hypothetical protein
LNRAVQLVEKSLRKNHLCLDSSHALNIDRNQSISQFKWRREGFAYR